MSSAVPLAEGSGSGLRSRSFLANRSRVELQKDGSDGPAAPASKYPLSFGKMMVYSNIKFMLSLYDFTLRPSRVTTYIEGLGMAAGTQGMIISICQSIGLVMGIVIGKVSDDTRTRWGRRKPFLAVAMPLGTICFVLFCTPTLTVFSTVDSNIVMADCSEFMSDCSALETCLTSTFNISDAHPSGTLPVVPDQPGIVPTNEGLLALWFGVFYAGYYTLIWSATSIPYDALGMELTDDSERRVMLFAVRGVVQIVGYLLPNILLLFVSGYFAGDVPGMYAFLSMVFGVMGLIAVALVLLTINERQDIYSDEKETVAKVPFVPQVRRLLANRAYRKYLALRAPLTIVTLLPGNMALFFIKFAVGREDFVSINAGGSIAGSLGVVFGTFPVMYLAKKLGRGRVIITFSSVMVVLWISLFLMPGSVVNDNVWIYFVANLCVGLSVAAFVTLPDGLLADCIDYDELLTGSRNEAMYTVVETQLALSIEIIGGVLPLLVLQFLDFRNNGGCLCGCGNPCSAVGVPYGRWVCPGDIGFTCDGRASSPLLFGGDRAAPCTAQSETVEWAIKFFYCGLPALCAILAMIPAATWPMDAKVNEDLMRELQLRTDDPEYVCTDPITGEKVHMPSNEEKDLFREHFQPWEWARAQDAGDRLSILVKLKSVVNLQFMTFIVLALVALAAIFVSQVDAIRTMGIFFFTLMVVLITWNGLRLEALKRPPADAAAGPDSAATELIPAAAS